jgi:hypothetical protein
MLLLRAARKTASAWACSGTIADIPNSAASAPRDFSKPEDSEPIAIFPMFSKAAERP